MNYDFFPKRSNRQRRTRRLVCAGAVLALVGGTAAPSLTFADADVTDPGVPGDGPVANGPTDTTTTSTPPVPEDNGAAPGGDAIVFGGTQQVSETTQPEPSPPLSGLSFVPPPTVPPGSGGGSDVIGPPPPLPPIRLFATCAVVRNGVRNVWLGYENTLDRRVVVPVGASNSVRVDSVVVPNGGQVVQFQPLTRVDRAFVVAVPAGTVNWTIIVPDAPAEAFTGFTSSMGSFNEAACPSGTPIRSATPQLALGQTDGIALTVENERLNSSGKLVRASVRFSVTGVVSACSAGGTPLPPRVLFGYAGPTNQHGNSTDFNLLASGGAAYSPIPAHAIVRTTVGSPTDVTVVVQWTYRAVRQVVEPQRLWTFTSVPSETLYFPAAFGLSSEKVIADVTARCQFGDQIVRSSTVYWVDQGGRFVPFITSTDPILQTTVRPDICNRFLLSPTNPAGTCDVPAVDIGPGSSRFR